MGEPALLNIGTVQVTRQRLVVQDRSYLLREITAVYIGTAPLPRSLVLLGLLLGSGISIGAQAAGNLTFVLVSAVDYYIRAFTALPASPASWLAAQLAQQLHLPARPIDKAPKIFAARVGFVCSLTSISLYPRYRTRSRVVALVLLSFALLESVLNICAGCLVYTYLVFPRFKPKG
ncbi:MAG: DUF4395 domain-containing protein [Chloroflexi bacterium]|nr:DUF4395 domain-containing protein [Chloroflexota bacterium]